MRRTRMALLSALVVTFALIGGGMAEARHSWNGYKWATKDRVVDLYIDFTSVRGAWTSVTGQVVEDWDISERLELDTRPVGQPGAVTVRNANYGPTGWLGVTMVNLDARQRITAARVLLNDWYWRNGFLEGLEDRRQVLCHELGHGFGLDHRVGPSCLNNSAGTLGDYVSPDTHDYEQLDQIYSRVDGYDSGTLGGSSGNTRRARAAQSWVVVHAYPAPDHRPHTTRSQR